MDEVVTNLSTIITKLRTSTSSALTPEEISSIEKEIKYVSLYAQSLSVLVQIVRAQRDYEILGITEEVL